MSWSYDPTLLKDSPLMQTRLVLGDTDPEDPLMQDEEIQAYLDMNGDNIDRAALSSVVTIISRITSEPDYRLGPYSESTGNRLRWYQSLLAQLQDKVTGYQPPLSKNPTSNPIFGYDMMSPGCDLGHITEEGD